MVCKLSRRKSVSVVRIFILYTLLSGSGISPWDVLVAFLKESWVERSSCKSRLLVVLRFLRLSAEFYKDNEVKERVFREALKD